MVIYCWEDNNVTIIKISESKTYFKIKLPNWMHNLQNSSIQSAKIISASFVLCDCNLDDDSSSKVEMVPGDQSTKNVSILPKRECIFALYFPWKEEFAGKIYML